MKLKINEIDRVLNTNIWSLNAFFHHRFDIAHFSLRAMKWREVWVCLERLKRFELFDFPGLNRNFREVCVVVQLPPHRAEVWTVCMLLRAAEVEVGLVDWNSMVQLRRSRVGSSKLQTGPEGFARALQVESRKYEAHVRAPLRQITLLKK